jgi:hypothetical protein
LPDKNESKNPYDNLRYYSHKWRKGGFTH